MAYDMYLDTMLLPVTPSKLNIKIANKNTTMMLINDGEINILKKAGLTEVSFTALLPQTRYPFAIYKYGFQKADVYLDKLESLKTSQKPFQFIVSRRFPQGGRLFDTNLKVSLEDYKIVEDSGNGFDVNVEIKLKQYRDYQTKTVSITIKQEETPTKPTTKTNEGGGGSSPTTTATPVSIKVGDMVKINSGAKYYTGKSVPAWVMKGTYKVYQVGATGKPDYVVIDKTGINSPFHAADLTVVTATTATVSSTRSNVSAPQPKQITINSGDTLWGLAKKYLGNGAKYSEIYNKNKAVIEAAAKKHGFASSSNGNRIWAGTNLIMPY